jgi:hypothetical protein
MAKYKFVARVALKGDFDAEDGLGTALQEVPAGQKAGTDDKKLYDSLIEQGYAKSVKDAAKDEDEAVAVSSDPKSAPKVESTDKQSGKK